MFSMHWCLDIFLMKWKMWSTSWNWLLEIFFLRVSVALRSSFSNQSIDEYRVFQRTDCEMKRVWIVNSTFCQSSSSHPLRNLVLSKCNGHLFYYDNLFEILDFYFCRSDIGFFFDCSFSNFLRCWFRFLHFKSYLKKNQPVWNHYCYGINFFLQFSSSFVFSHGVKFLFFSWQIFSIFVYEYSKCKFSLKIRSYNYYVHLSCKLNISISISKKRTLLNPSPISIMHMFRAVSFTKKLFLHLDLL